MSLSLTLPVHFAVGALAVGAARLYVRKILRSYNDLSPIYDTCPNCGGTGRIAAGPGTRTRGCSTCHHHGTVATYTNPPGS